MTELTQEVFDRYQVRKTKAQKEAFALFVKESAEERGYEFNMEQGRGGVKNLVVGDPERAEVVYTAHYDTCARLPFPNFITPKAIGLYLLYQLAIVIGFFLVAFLIGFCSGILVSFVGEFLGLSRESGGAVAQLIALVGYFGLLALLYIGPANKHTANDNTSGVTLLLDIMDKLPAEVRGRVAFIFFDREEMGLVGSRAYAKRHKGAMAGRLLVNFDCVSDGENMLFVLRKKAKDKRELIETAFAPAEGFKVEVVDKAFYPSDQASFDCGVGVAALRSTKGGLLYMNRIHTARDTVYCEENIEFLRKGAIKLAELMGNRESHISEDIK